ncbi:MAG: sigma-54-dependent Fis family transcriptional regulator [Candidatus Omnitrophica bacterium]|nr:sigma-54-dependent Fis family transcriptional regulator [Candidatus Omnitrophota bacterium]
MNRRLLFAWIGATDLRAASGVKEVGLGPIAQAVTGRDYDQIVLLCDYHLKEGKSYVAWLSGQTKTKITLQRVTLSGPTHFGEIYENAVGVLQESLQGMGAQFELTFHLSPGTPAMAAVWIILSKTRFPAELIESSREHGVRTASVPFDLSAEYLPDLLRKPDEQLRSLSEGLPPDAPEFSDIVHRCESMRRVIGRARKVAPRNVPVLILGESGTGKELLARAIHDTSPRRDRPFIAVNCGAIPPNLVESQFFGHEKGAFTGADRAKRGFVEEASEGTLFLDEVGELPLDAQVRFLRVLQSGTVTRVGASRETPVDVRVIAATNRDLFVEVPAGRFREDLFQRLAVAILQLPPLRERQGDIGLLIDRLLNQVNNEGIGQPGYRHKTLSASARSLLLRQEWPGNVRELLNTLRRASIWSGGAVIEEPDIRDSILPMGRQEPRGLLDRPLGEGLNLPEMMAELATHYLKRAMQESGGNKTKAAELVGLPSYQTLTNWLRRYGLTEILA